MVVLTMAGACLLHAFLVLFGGGKAGFRVTARVVAYVTGAMLMLAVVPCGWGFAPFAMLAYLSVTLREAHRDAAWKPLAAMAGRASVPHAWARLSWPWPSVPSSVR
jgi:hypothetical protein